jgi:integrase
MAKDPGISDYRLNDGRKRYRVRLMRDGRAYKWEGFETVTEARQWRDDRKQDVRHGREFPEAPDEPAPIRTIGQVIDDYLVESKHKKDYAGEVTLAQFWKALHGDRDPASVIPEDIAHARRQLLTVGLSRGPLSPARVNRYVSWYHHVLQILVDQDSLTRNPCRQFIRSVRKGGQRFVERPAPEQVWSDAELLMLSEELGDQMLYPLFAILTGLRQGEQFRLRKDQLDLQQGFGYLGQTKANEGQPFALNADAIDIARLLMAKAPDSPFLFPSPRWPKTKPMSAKHWYRCTFKPACQRAGIILSRKDGKTWHTLRHSFADRLVEQKVHIHEVQQAGRWNSAQAMGRYLKKRRDRVAAGVALLKSPIPLVRFLYGGNPPFPSSRPQADILSFSHKDLGQPEG